MFRVRSKLRFKQHYLEHILAGHTSEQSADEAMTETKKEMLEILDSDKKLSESRKTRLWAIAMDELLDWQMLLVDLPHLTCNECRREIKKVLKKIEGVGSFTPVAFGGPDGLDGQDS